MELVISKKNLLRGLTRTTAVADRKSTMPILSNVLVQTSDTASLRFAGTDLYLGVLATVPCEVKRGGAVAVSARMLHDIAKNLPEGDVTFTVGPNHGAEIRAGKVRYRIPGMPGDDFPPLPALPSGTELAQLDVDMLTDLIGKTAFSMSTDDTRPHLSGALFEGEGKTVRMVTTDGHRLSKAEHRTREGAPMVRFAMLVPQKGVGELRRMLDEVRSEAKGNKDEGPPQIGVAVHGGSAFFVHGALMLSVKLAEEQFPPYSKVIPQNQDKRVVIARTGLVEALRRMSLVASDKSGGVRFQLSAGSLRIVSENPDLGEGSEELDVDYAGSPLTIGFNAKYLQDALNALSDDQVALELAGELDPGVLRPASDPNAFVGVIMPMRI
jgi:DNA polymerase-3 subunit beta